MQQITTGPRGGALSLAMMAVTAISTTGAQAQAFDRYVLVQPIQVCDDDGTNCAAITHFPTETRAIYRQAGVLPLFLLTQQLHDSAANSASGIADIDADGAAGGTTVEAWFVSHLDAAPGSVLYGEAWVAGNGLVVNAPAVTGFGEVGRIDTFAHELGHNFGLRHETLGAGGADNLMTTGSTRDIPTGPDDIAPGGAGLDVLTADQITQVRGSTLAQTANDCIGGNLGDVFTLDYGDVCLNLHALDGADTVTLNGGAVLQTLSGGGGNDLIRIRAGGVGGDLRGDDGADILRVFAGAFVMGAVDGGPGSDIISISGDAARVLGGTGGDNIAIEFCAVIDGDIYGDDGDGDESNGDGDDIITVNAGALVGGSIFGEGGSDLITLNDGRVRGDIDGGGGDDVLGVLGGTLDGSLIGGSGRDRLTVTGGLIGGNVEGGSDGDWIWLLAIAGDVDGGTVSGDIDGGDGDDMIDIDAGTVLGSVLGGGGADTITLTGGSIGGDVRGEAGGDAIMVHGGTVNGNVDGGDGDDHFDISGGAIRGNLLGGAGNDFARWTGGTIGGFIEMGAGGDLLAIYGARSGGTALQAELAHIDGGGDAGDILNLHGVAEVLTDLRGWGGINLVDNSAGDLGPASRGITTGLFTIDPSSALVASSPGGGQVFTLDGDLANAGLVQMQGGDYDTLEVTGLFSGGPDSALAMDTYFGGAGAPSDLLRIGTGTAGTTMLVLGDTDAAGAGAFNPEGIELVRVEGVPGSTTRGDFRLVGGPVNKGLWVYDLGFDDSRSVAGRAGADVHVLYSRPSDAVIFAPRFAAGALAAFDASLAPWAERQRAPTPVAERQRGAWVGTDTPAVETWVTAFGTRQTGRGQAQLTLLGDSHVTTTDDRHANRGIVVGLDRRFDLGDGREWMTGIFAGQVVAVTRADRISLRGEFSGATLGVHAGYTVGGWRLGGVVKADFLDFDWSAPALGLEASTDVTTLGARIEAAWRPPTGSPTWIEPHASLTWAQSDWGRLELFDTGFDLSGNESVLGRAGLRLGRDIGTVHARIELFAGAGIAYEFHDTSHAEVLSGGYTLPLEQSRDREALEIEAGLRWTRHDGNMSLSLTSGGRFSEHSRQVDVRATFDMRF